MESENQQQGQPLQNGTAGNRKLHAELLRYYRESTPVTVRQKTHHAEIVKMIGHEAVPLPRPNHIQNEVHQKAAVKLHKRFPKLSSSAIDIAVMLGQGHSTKRIAAYRGITERGVEKARARLRKKMKLKRGDDLLTKIRKIIN